MHRSSKSLEATNKGEGRGSRQPRAIGTGCAGKSRSGACVDQFHDYRIWPDDGQRFDTKSLTTESDTSRWG